MTKKDVKEWGVIAGLTALTLVIGFHLNSFGGADKSNNNDSGAVDDTTPRLDSVAPRDTVDVMHNVRAAQEMFMDGVRRGLPSR